MGDTDAVQVGDDTAEFNCMTNPGASQVSDHLLSYTGV